MERHPADECVRRPAALNVLLNTGERALENRPIVGVDAHRESESFEALAGSTASADLLEVKSLNGRLAADVDHGKSGRANRPRGIPRVYRNGRLDSLPQYWAVSIEPPQKVNSAAQNQRIGNRSISARELLHSCDCVAQDGILDRKDVERGDGERRAAHVAPGPAPGLESSSLLLQRHDLLQGASLARRWRRKRRC